MPTFRDAIPRFRPRPKSLKGSGNGSAPVSAAPANPELVVEPQTANRRVTSEAEFLAGVSHHWAPLLTQAFLNAKRAETRLR